MVKGIPIELQKETGLGTVAPDSGFFFLQLVLLAQGQSPVVPGQGFLILATAVVGVSLRLELRDLLLQLQWNLR